MKIVVLDGFPINPGDLSWHELESLGACTFYDRTTRDELISRAQKAEILIANKIVFDKAAFDALPELRYIGITATGTNVIDLDAAKARGVTVTNVPAYGAPTIAQSTFALLLELTNHTSHYNRAVRDGKWQASPDFCYWDRQITALSGLTLGVVGLGHIGQHVIVLARAFGMNVLVHTRTPRQAEFPDIDFCDLDDLFARADVVSLHCPLTAETKNLVNAARLLMMKSSAYLLNTARGPLVDEQALADALNAEKLAGAGLDVLSTEPPQGDNPLLIARNCIITPHIAWASLAARKKLLEVTLDNLRQFLKGQPVNVVNP